MQRMREREEKERKAEEMYQQKMREEAQRKKEAEEMILLLENEEKELILRLRKTQELQQDVRNTCSLINCAYFYFRPTMYCSNLFKLNITNLCN